jgi:hypothetical protein
MDVTANGHGRSPPMTVQEEATIDANLRGEYIVHHGPCKPQNLLGSTVHL